MSAVVTILYPKTETSTFDSDYYMKKHMPFAEETWTPYGLTKVIVTKFDESAPYSYQALLFFKNQEAWAKVNQAPETQAVMADVPNYSSEAPVLLVGNEVPKAA